MADRLKRCYGEDSEERKHGFEATAAMKTDQVQFSCVDGTMHQDFRHDG